MDAHMESHRIHHHSLRGFLGLWNSRVYLHCLWTSGVTRPLAPTTHSGTHSWHPEGICFEVPPKRGHSQSRNQNFLTQAQILIVCIWRPTFSSPKEIFLIFYHHEISLIFSQTHFCCCSVWIRDLLARLVNCCDVKIETNPVWLSWDLWIGKYLWRKGARSLQTWLSIAVLNGEIRTCAKEVLKTFHLSLLTANLKTSSTEMEIVSSDRLFCRYQRKGSESLPFSLSCKP